MPGYEEIFFGGVTAFHPPVTRLPPASSSHFSLTAATMRLLHGCPCAPQDFSRLNGFPNDHWGLGMEDDQLRLRADASGAIAQGVGRLASRLFTLQAT